VGNSAALGKALRGLLNQLVQSFFRTPIFPSCPETHWAEFGPALELLATKPWVGGLRRLRIASSQSRDLLELLSSQFSSRVEQITGKIPDSAVFALADALNPDKLETLVLPAGVIGSSSQERLVTRFGSRVTFV
jgi:hypothetical protein